MSEEPKGEIAPGRLVAGYAIQGHLGRTAWAETYVASGPEDELMALKVVDSSIAGATGVGEAIERARVSTTSIPDLLIVRPIVAAEEGGVRFIATPLSDHPSLADLVDICPLSPSEAIGVVKNLAIAIEAAHTAGVAHLAIKPRNVFVGPPPTHAVKLADFGADALRRAKDAKAGHPWIAPEQEAEDEAGKEADIHALALVAFFAIAGRPYEAKDGEQTKPSELAPDIPEALDAPLLRALSSTPSERWPSARDLAEALERALAEPAKDPTKESKPAMATPAPPSQRHVKATQRLERFRLPSEERLPAAKPMPAIDRTVKLEKFDGPVISMPPDVVSLAPGDSLVPDSGAAPVEEKKTTRPVPGVPSIKQTAKLVPAVIPEPTPDTAPVAHKRFYLPEQAPGPTAPLPPPIATVRPPPPAIASAPRATAGRDLGSISVGAYVRRVQDAWTSGDKRQRQLVIAWAIFAVIAVIAVLLGLASIVRALVSTSSSAPNPVPSASVPEAPSSEAPPAAAPPPIESADPPDPLEAELEVVCIPECDKVYVNNNRMAAYPNSIKVDAGTYGIGVAKTGYAGQYLNVPVKAGEKKSVTFKLNALNKK